jgi:hypothetical protein
MSPPPTKKTIVQYGLSEVFSAPDPEVEYVHSLEPQGVLPSILLTVPQHRIRARLEWKPFQHMGYTA